MLTGALFNQRRWEAAWDSLRVAPALEPSNKDHAVAWIVLGGRFRTDPEFARDLLRAIDKFPTSVDVTAAAISTYAIWSAGDVELPAEVVVESTPLTLGVGDLLSLL